MTSLRGPINKYDLFDFGNSSTEKSSPNKRAQPSKSALRTTRLPAKMLYNVNSLRLVPG